MRNSLSTSPPASNARPDDDHGSSYAEPVDYRSSDRHLDERIVSRLIAVRFSARM